MTDEGEESEFSRRHFAYVVGGTLTATAGSAWYVRDILDGIFENKDEPGNFGETDSTSEDTGTTVDYPGRGDGAYENWQDAIPGGCELPSSYETAVEDKIDAYDELDEDNLTDYVNTGRVQFRRGESEVYMLVDADGDGQYDDKGHSIPDVCG